MPKTIDNDVAFVARSFGYLSAVAAAARVLQCAHAEAHSVRNGIAIVKLMGRHAGFIAASATVASQDVNFTLVPEVPFALEGPRGCMPSSPPPVNRRSSASEGRAVARGSGCPPHCQAITDHLAMDR